MSTSDRLHRVLQQALTGHAVLQQALTGLSPLRPAIASVFILLSLCAATDSLAQSPKELDVWLGPQSWHRDTAGPVLSLGKPGQFDDTHIFAPLVAYEQGVFRLWYCGSRGAVSQRVFRLGLSTSTDGRDFVRHENNPVYEMPDGRRSVLTPTLLRSGDGNAVTENGRLQMWFSSTDFQDKSGLHTLHRCSSEDGIQWSKPSDGLLKHVYAPTVLRDGDMYRMWFVDVRQSPWIVRHADSADGENWEVTSDPCLVIDQSWERSRLFYPTVLKLDGVYLMWYGSYWSQHRNTTATGFAASTDGLAWHKHPMNPVLRPAAERPWESHYVTSQSVLRLPDGSIRIWFASRRKPPFVNKYFAINTAIWQRNSTRRRGKRSLEDLSY